MSNKPNRQPEPPARFKEFMRTYPEIGKAYQALGDATRRAGPLDARTISLVKLGIAIGMRQEGAVHAHARKALGAGCTPEEIRHAALLATTTLGFPAMMAALSQVDDILADPPEMV